jgi:hypothetical protein
MSIVSRLNHLKAVALSELQFLTACH